MAHKQAAQARQAAQANSLKLKPPQLSTININDNIHNRTPLHSQSSSSKPSKIVHCHASGETKGKLK